MNWESRMVALLAEYKLQGFSFDWAWRESVAVHPPRGGSWASRELFDEDGQPTEDRVTFFRRACDDAWHGRKPGLRELPVVIDRIAA